MNSSQTILRNSFFLTVQPLVLNFISLFVVGYIARKLGPSDFGIFNFVTIYIMFFYPIGIMGLNRITVREMAGMDGQESYASKMISLRIGTAIVSLIMVFIITQSLGYESRMKYAVYIGALFFMLQLQTEAFADIFNANEKMEFTALTNFITGISLTILSVVVLYMGFGLFTLLGTYVIGNLLGLFTARILLAKQFFKPSLKIDVAFIKEKLKNGFPFFLMTMLWFFIMRFDLIVLSKTVDPEIIGIYTAGILLVTKLSIIPQGLSTSVLPTVSKLIKRGETEEACNMTKKFITGLLTLSIPFAAGISFFAEEFMTLVFGAYFLDSGPVFMLAIWIFPARCLSFVIFAFLTAAGKQESLLRCYWVGAAYCFVANILLTVNYGILGALFCYFTTQLMLMVLFGYYLLKQYKNILEYGKLMKILGATGVMLIFLKFTGHLSISNALITSMGMGFYGTAVAKIDFLIALVMAYFLFLILGIWLKLINIGALAGVVKAKFAR